MVDYLTPTRGPISPGNKRMNNKLQRLIGLGCCAVSLIFMSSCLVRRGARVVDSNYQPKVVVEYQVNGKLPSGTRIALIHEKGKVALLEVKPGERPLVIQHAQTDSDGDHFMLWHGESFAVHYLVPTDRRLAAYRWEYRAGQYQLKSTGPHERPGLALPSPTSEVEAVVQLVPQKRSGG